MIGRYRTRYKAAYDGTVRKFRSIPGLSDVSVRRPDAACGDDVGE
jgi:hypothetical protein